MKIKTTTPVNLDGSHLKIHIILPFFNDSLGQNLLTNTQKALLNYGVTPKNIKITRVPGTLEIPFAAHQICKKKSADAIIALGIVIRGDTTHYDHVCNTTISAITKLNITHDTPIITGILTTENLQQAQDRINPKKLNKGHEFAIAAIQMGNLKKKI